MSGEADQQRACVECGEAFAFTVAEQQFRAEQGMNPPVRCPDCRAARRAQRNADLLSPVSRSYGGDDQQNGRRRQPRNHRGQNPADRYPAICAACGASTMVPFIPRGDRPVYCRSCYNARRGR